ncbi:ABC transporter substrate-binding protein [Roseomonas sp. E05]|uniref:ABC transporter substrate-binding protein n=1 Tax=Roseomonas sp. E05 TaxID=3046310 RepID=UPI0024B9A45F|nr:ABC transporter substrate-binding protein [Roseomonas sp. E05]MDJ0391554.1 ABC transporter substrate-binding protein [Roseomonas sp. E05]
MTMRFAQRLALFLLAACAAAPGIALAQGSAPAGAAPGSTLRVSLNTELQVLDPIVTTTNATRVFAHMVFDTLVGVNGKGEYKPQMLEGWAVSEDRLTYTFTLRDGLAFSDGRPVTAEDCVASLLRWAKRESLGKQLMAVAEGFRILDPRTFELKLAQPYSFVIESLGKPGHQIPVIMPKRLAELSVDRPVPEVVGSGPYLWRQDLWRPGERAFLDRNPAYKPRPEPPDALAGGKLAKMDRVELVSMPDQATRVAALQANEVDLLEIVPADFIPLLRKDGNVTLGETRGGDQIMGILVMNQAQPPFNNRKVRQALQMAVSQPDVMASLGLPEDMYLQDCRSIYMCNAAHASTAGTEIFRHAGLERARALLQESGYRNERVVFLHAASSAILNPMGLVIADAMKQAGFNLDVATSDYATVAQRRESREPVEKGGWSVVPLIWNGIDLVNANGNPAVSYNCGDSPYGWYCDPKATPLLKELAAAATPEERKDVADRLQAAFHENVNIILTGQFAAPPAYRSELKGVMPFSFPLLWNISRGR